MDRNWNHARKFGIGKSSTATGYSKISLKSFIPVIESSVDENRLWVSDFQNDPIFVPNDLFDVVKAFEHFYGEIRDSA